MRTADLQLPKTFVDARNLAARFQSSEGFQQYLRSHMRCCCPRHWCFC